MAGAQSLSRTVLSSALSRPWSCGIWQKRPTLVGHFGLVEDVGEVQAPGLPMVDGLPDFEPVGAADHLVHLRKPSWAIDLAHFLRR